MKVLVTRLWDIVSCRLVVLADQFKWSTISAVSILQKILSFFKIEPTTPLSQLTPEILRKAYRLAELLCKYPDLFFRVFECFTSIPISRMDRILEIDKQFLKTPLFYTYETN